MTTLVKWFLPGSLLLLWVGLLLGWWLTRGAGRRRTAGRVLSTGLVLAYVFMSLPRGAEWLARPLGWGFSAASDADVAGAGAIVVLDGGTARCTASGQQFEFANVASTLRAAETLRVSAMMRQPLVVVTGGDAVGGPGTEAQALAGLLTAGGHPADRVIVDQESVNTRAHAVNVTQMLRSRGISRFVLVTSSTHIRRATAAFRAVGADVVPSPAPIVCDGSLRGVRGFLPTTTALNVSESAAHDYLGLIYYWLKGWV